QLGEERVPERGLTSDDRRCILRPSLHRDELLRAEDLLDEGSHVPTIGPCRADVAEPGTESPFEREAGKIGPTDVIRRDRGDVGLAARSLLRVRARLVVRLSSRLDPLGEEPLAMHDLTAAEVERSFDRER